MSISQEEEMDVRPQRPQRLHRPQRPRGRTTWEPRPATARLHCPTMCLQLGHSQDNQQLHMVLDNVRYWTYSKAQFGLLHTHHTHPEEEGATELSRTHHHSDCV